MPNRIFSRLPSRCLPLIASAFLLAACASQPEPPPPTPQSSQPQTQPTPKATPEASPAPKLKRTHPIRYVVKKGDTLWDISAHFLKSPWLWPDIWYVNPQIRNPHLIYPGDVIELRWVNGKPRLTLANAGDNVEHLSPEVHGKPIEEAIPTIPISAIKPFLTRALVVSDDQLDTAPYVLATADGRLLAGEHSRVFVKGIQSGDGEKWLLVRKGGALHDPDSGDVLGYKAVFVGKGRIAQWTDPAVFALTRTARGVEKGDRLVAGRENPLPVNFTPHAPAGPISGDIISVIDGMTQISRYDVVIIDRGRNDDVDPGTVLAIYQQGRVVDDPYNGDDVQLPDRRAGLLMVFRTFDKVSYGLVMTLHREAHVLDVVTKP